MLCVLANVYILHSIGQPCNVDICVATAVEDTATVTMNYIAFRHIDVDDLFPFTVNYLGSEIIRWVQLSGVVGAGDEIVDHRRDSRVNNTLHLTAVVDT